MNKIVLREFTQLDLFHCRATPVALPQFLPWTFHASPFFLVKDFTKVLENIQKSLSEIYCHIDSCLMLLHIFYYMLLFILNNLMFMAALLSFTKSLLISLLHFELAIGLYYCRTRNIIHIDAKLMSKNGYRFLFYQSYNWHWIHNYSWRLFFVCFPFK